MRWMKEFQQLDLLESRVNSAVKISNILMCILVILNTVRVIVSIMLKMSF